MGFVHGVIAAATQVHFRPASRSKRPWGMWTTRQNAAVLKPFIAVALTDTLYRLTSAVLYLESDSCLFQVAV